jgi:hypothetical protein
MRFLNFDLSIASYAIEFVAEGFIWDVHNLSDFNGLHVSPVGQLTLTWLASQGSTWGDYSNDASGFQLVFRGLRRLEVTGGDASMPTSEQRSVAGISRVVPTLNEPAKYRVRNEWPEGTPFNLWITFQGGLSIEIDAEEAEFESLHS